MNEDKSDRDKLEKIFCFYSIKKTVKLSSVRHNQLFINLGLVWNATHAVKNALGYCDFWQNLSLTSMMSKHEVFVPSSFYELLRLVCMRVCGRLRDDGAVRVAAAGAAGQPSTTVAAISEWRWGGSAAPQWWLPRRRTLFLLWPPRSVRSNGRPTDSVYPHIMRVYFDDGFITSTIHS